MPAPVVKSMAKKAGVSVSAAEKRWDKAERMARKAKKDGKIKGKDGIYAYAMGIFKRMMGIKECFNPFYLEFAQMLLEKNSRAKCESDEEDFEEGDCQEGVVIAPHEIPMGVKKEKKPRKRKERK